MADGANAKLAAAVVLVAVAVSRLLVVEEIDGETGRLLLPPLVATFLLHAVTPQLVRARASVSRGLLPKLQPRRPESMYLAT